MADDAPSKRERLTKLKEDLKELESTLPEHCFGKEGYINRHHATPAHWQKIEDIEEEIKALKAELED